MGMRKYEYSGNDFSVRIEPAFREDVGVIYTRHGNSLKLVGELIGKNWEGISAQIPTNIEDSQVAGIVSHLETAFVELGFGYVIDRRVGVDTIPDSERQAALAELREMGCEIEVLPGRRIHENLKTGAPRQDIETIRQQMPRRFSLIKSLSGTRDRIEILAKSKEF